MDTRVERLFMIIDVDGSGRLSFSELVNVMAQSEGSTQASAHMSAERLFAQADISTSREVAVDDFLRIFRAEKVRWNSAAIFVWSHAVLRAVCE